MNTFFYPLQKLNGFERAKECLDTGKTCQVTGCADSQLAHFITGLSDGYKNKVIVTFSGTKAKELYEDLKAFDKNVVLYPAKDFIFFSADVHGNVILQQRLECIKKLVEDKPCTIVTTADGLMDKIMPLDRIKENVLEISEGSIIEMDAIRHKLVQMGYEGAEQVESPGQFAIRGSIIDIYTLTDEVPYRIDMWDDEVDIIKSFEVETQRSIENLEKITIYPATDYVLTKEEIRAGIDKIKKDLKKNSEALRKQFKTEEAHRLEVIIKEFIDNEEINENGMSFDSYVNYFYDGMVSFIDYLKDAAFFIDEPKRVDEQMKAVETEFRDSMSNRLEKGYVLPGQTDIVWSRKTIESKLDSVKKVLFTSVIMVCASLTRAKRLAEDLRGFGISAFYEEDKEREALSGEVMIVTGHLRGGFAYPMIKFVVISDTDIFGETKKKRRKKHNYSGTNISDFSDLNIGDYVVHENHGLGIYKGIEKIEVDRTVKDYIKIEYEGGSNLYILATQLDMIQKYADSEAKPPKLNKLGGTEWKKTKTRVKKAVADIADELIELYATRQDSTGFVFSPDTEWQKEFEEMFPFEETDDQLEVISQVKADMESTKTMDRLVCGDVGFGKTEVAIRAAFKAVQDNKQVVYLVPTTVLAQQHYKTFTQRFKDFPVRVEMLSRFRTKANQEQTIRDLKKGYVDIVIGTHRVLSKDVKFKDLGLLIIDEEQRFGVKHKEKIKELKNNIDVLTMTATPIPRTLHMSLIGIRDMSIMEEPPQDRMPIQTYVMEYNDEIVREAINRELLRNGQVYYVYNIVQNIAERAAEIQRLVPDANVAFAHGQMSERQLETIMYDFVNGDIDVLVSTTIIETGIDVSNANTIIIHNAEKMGLSQLYQLRGRVGRSNRTAYAFMMYTRNKLLSEVAEKRLGAIKNFTELGSGVKIAMRDLEIRGTGNLLGAQQHGHMEAVGYDLYCKMLNEAILVRKGKTPTLEFETKIDVLIDAFVPAGYIKSESQKMDVYKRIAGIETQEEYEDMQDELIDRFGEMPRQVENLLKIVLIKATAHEAYITEITGNKTKLKFTMHPTAPIETEKIPEILSKYNRRLKLIPDKTPYFEYIPMKPAKDADELMENMRKVIEDIRSLKRS